MFDYISYEPGSLDAGNDLDGVDLNRNYDFHFDNQYYYEGTTENMGVSDSPHGCSGYSFGEYSSSYDYYRGASAFSESETRAIRDLVLDKNFILSNMLI